MAQNFGGRGRGNVTTSKGQAHLALIHGAEASERRRAVPLPPPAPRRGPSTAGWRVEEGIRGKKGAR